MREWECGGGRVMVWVRGWGGDGGEVVLCSPILRCHDR